MRGLQASAFGEGSGLCGWRIEAEGFDREESSLPSTCHVCSTTTIRNRVVHGEAEALGEATVSLPLYVVAVAQQQIRMEWCKVGSRRF